MARIVETANQLTGAAWAGDYFNREHMVPGGAKIAAASWASVTTVHTITAAAEALATAESITVEPLTVALPAGTVLDFEGAGKFALLTAAAAVGAETLVVEALPETIADEDEATYSVTVTDAAPVTVPSGTVVGRTFAEAAAGTALGPAAAGDDQVYIVCFDVYDVATNNDAECYRPGSIVKENFLPGWSGLGAAVQALVRAAYTCVQGQA